jgi:hypothetical protein
MSDILIKLKTDSILAFFTILTNKRGNNDYCFLLYLYIVYVLFGVSKLF